MNVLLTGSCSVTGINVIRALQKDNINVMGCDFNKYNPANKFCENKIVPRANEINYFENIVHLIDKYNITHIIASNDHDVRSLMNNYEYLKQMGVNFNGAGLNTLNCLDKMKTYDVFSKYNVLTPELVDSNDDFPYVLRKMLMGSSSKFLHIVKDNDKKNSIDSNQFEIGIKTRYYEGDEYTTDFLCDNDSNLIYAIPRLRVNVQNGMVHHAVIVYDEKLINIIKDISLKLKLVGVNCIQCIKCDDKYYFIEINPRPGSGIDLSINAGINMPAIWVKESFDIKLKINWNLKMLRYYDGYYFE